MTSSWLETVSPGKWNQCIVKKGDHIAGILTYVVENKMGFKLIVPPHLTPYMGVWINYPNDLAVKSRLSYDKEVMTELIEQLPKHDFISMKFPPNITNWLPFYWKDFEQTSRYTYIIPELGDMDKVRGNFSESTRRQIKKGEKSLQLSEGTNIDVVYDMLQRNKNHLVKFSAEYLQKIWEFCQNNNCGRIFLAHDEQNNLHATMLIVWDNETAYYLIGCAEDKFRNSGAMSYLMWQAIKFSGSVTKSFNFEGSMLEPIERFFRGFGGELTPYFSIEKYNSLRYKMLKKIK